MSSICFYRILNASEYSEYRAYIASYKISHIEIAVTNEGLSKHNFVMNYRKTTGKLRLKLAHAGMMIVGVFNKFLALGNRRLCSL